MSVFLYGPGPGPGPGPSSFETMISGTSSLMSQLVNSLEARLEGLQRKGKLQVNSRLQAQQNTEHCVEGTHEIYSKLLKLQSSNFQCGLHSEEYSRVWTQFPAQETNDQLSPWHMFSNLCPQTQVYHTQKYINLRFVCTCGWTVCSGPVTIYGNTIVIIEGKFNLLNSLVFTSFCQDLF